jgi:hypothetical protein
MQVSLMADSRPSHLAFQVYNSGGGIAKGTGFCFVSGDKVCAGHLGDGFLRSNETAYLGTDLPVSDSTQGIVFCLDRDQRAHAWNLAGELKTFTFGKDKPFVTASEAFGAHYPGEDLSALQPVTARLGSPPTRLG